MLGSLYRQQQAAAVAAQQALQGGQESEDDMEEDGGESLQCAIVCVSFGSTGQDWVVILGMLRWRT